MKRLNVITTICKIKINKKNIGGINGGLLAFFPHHLLTINYNFKKKKL